MRYASLKFKPVWDADNSLDSKAGAAPSKLAASLTLAAMSLGYGVVQLDVTIVNTALNAIGTSLGGGVAELQWVVSALHHRFCGLHPDGGRAGRPNRFQADIHRGLCPLYGGLRCLRAGAQCGDPDFRALCPGAGGRHPGAELFGVTQSRLCRRKSSRT